MELSKTGEQMVKDLTENVQKVQNEKKDFSDHMETVFTKL